MNDEFMGKLDAERIRDDDVFNAAVVSFGAFGIITAVAIETDPIYQLKVPPVKDIAHDALKHKLTNFDFGDPSGLYHYEFIFDPYSKTKMAMEALATKVDFEPGHPAPDPVWIVRSDKGFAPGDKAAAILIPSSGNSQTGSRTTTGSHPTRLSDFFRQRSFAPSSTQSYVSRKSGVRPP
jgi:hypothetical protein